MRVIRYSTSWWRRTDHDRSFDYYVYCFFAICVSIDVTFFFRCNERSGLGTTRATTTHSRRALCCRPHKARSHMNARSHTDIELGIRKPLDEHWTGVLPYCLMLRCRKHSEGSFASSVSPNNRIFGFLNLVSRKASNRTERNPHICLCLSGARARNSQSTCFVSRTTPAYLGRYIRAAGMPSRSSFVFLF